MKKGFTKPFIHVIFLLASVVWLFSQENTIRIGDRIIELDDDILFENFDLRVPRQVPAQQPVQPTQSIPAQQPSQNIPAQQAPLTTEEEIISNYLLTNIYNTYATNNVPVTNLVEERDPSNILIVTNVIVSNTFDREEFSNYFAETISNLYNITNEYADFFNEMMETLDGKEVAVNSNDYNYHFSQVVSNIYFNTNEYNFSNFQSNFITNIYNQSNEYGFYYTEFYTNIVSNTYNFSNTQVNITNLENTFNNSNYYNFFYNQYYTNNYSNVITNTYNVSNYYGVVVGDGTNIENLSNAEIGPDGKLSFPKAEKKQEQIGSGNIDVPLMLLQTRELARKKRYQEALSLLNVIERHEPNNTRMLNMRGSIFYKLQFYEYALDAWGKSLSVNGDQPIVQYYYNRAAVRLRTIR